MAIDGPHIHSLRNYCCWRAKDGAVLAHVILQYAHVEWSSVMCPGHGLASQLAVVEAEMLPHMTSVNPYYFPAVIVPSVTVLLSLISH